MADIRFSTNTYTRDNYEVPTSVIPAVEFVKTKHQKALDAINYFVAAQFEVDNAIRVYVGDNQPLSPADGDLWWGSDFRRRYVSGLGNGTRLNRFADQRLLLPTLPNHYVNGGLKEGFPDLTLEDRPSVRYTVNDTSQEFRAGFLINLTSGKFSASFTMTSTERTAMRSFVLHFANESQEIVMEAPDIPTRVSITADVDAGVHTFYVTPGEGEEVMAGDVLFLAAPKVEAGEVDDVFFDGASQGATWTGTPGNSTSQYAPGWATESTGYLNDIIPLFSPEEYSDGFVDIFTGPTEPELPMPGDLWDDDQENLWKWNGVVWISLVDSGEPAIAEQLNEQARGYADVIEAIAGLEGGLDGVVHIFYQSTTPDPEEVGVGDIWIDTSDGKVMKRWDGDSWELIDDERIQDLLDEVDGKITSYFSDAEPVAPSGGFSVGDLWFETDQNNRLHRWDGQAWVDISDPRIPIIIDNIAEHADLISDALEDLVGLHGLLDGKAVIYYQPTAPTGMNTDNQGDVWIDTATDPATFKTWTGTEWVVITDPKALEALEKVNRKITVYYEDQSPAWPPEGFTIGDLWIRTTDGRLHVWDGTEWADASDARYDELAFEIADIYDDLITIEGIIDGKAVIYYQTSEPEGMGSENQGDIWIDLTTAPSTFKMWDGTIWVVITDPEAIKALEQVSGKITTYFSEEEPDAPDEGFASGDLWIRLPDNRLHRWNGTEWWDVADARYEELAWEIADIHDDLLGLEGLIDGVAVIYYQDTEPPGMTTENQGDIWIDTSLEPATFKSWSGEEWVIITDPEAVRALEQVSGKITTYYSDEEPVPTTYYRWTGEPHASTSEKVVDGQVVATNLLPNPAGTGTTGWYSNNSNTTPAAWDEDVYLSGPRSRAGWAISESASSISLYAPGGGSSSDAISPDLWDQEFTAVLYFRAPEVDIPSEGILSVSMQIGGSWTNIGGTEVALTRGEWTLASRTLTVPEGTTAMRLGARVLRVAGSPEFPAETRSWVDNAGFLIGADHYFDGDSPSSFTEGDLWIRTTDNRLHRWNGTEWVSMQDRSIEWGNNLIDNPSRTGDVGRWHSLGIPTGAETLSVEDVVVDGTNTKVLRSLSYLNGNAESADSPEKMFDIDPNKAYRISFDIWDEKPAVIGNQFQITARMMSLDGTYQRFEPVNRHTANSGGSTTTPVIHSYNVLNSGQYTGRWVHYVAYMMPSSVNPEDILGLGHNITSNLIMPPIAGKGVVRIYNMGNGTDSPRYVDILNPTVAEADPDVVLAALKAQHSADNAMDAANGKNKITYTDVPRAEAPGPTPTIAMGDGRADDDTHRNRATDNGEIFAEWRWTGSAWQEVNYGDEILRSLDVGKLTAGTADIETGVINKLRTNIITLASIGQEMLTTGDELSVNPTWSRTELINVTPYETGTGMSFSTISSYQYEGTDRVLYLASTASASSEVRLTDNNQVAPGEQIYGKMILRKVSATAPPASGVAVAMKVSWLDASGSLVSVSLLNTRHNNQWASFDSTFEAPAGASQFYVSLTAGDVAATYIIAHTSVRRAMGSISSTGEETVVSPSGVEVYARIETDEDTIERVLLTSMGRQYTAYDPEDDTTSTMTGSSISSPTISGDEVFVAGENIEDVFYSRPRGLILNDYADQEGSASSALLGYREVGFDAEGGRAYLITFMVDVNAGSQGSMFVHLHKTESETGSAPAPTVNSTIISRMSWRHSGGSDWFHGSTLLVPRRSENVRLLLSTRAGGSNVAKTMQSRINVVDVGPFEDLPNSGRYSNGGATPELPGPTPPPAPSPTPPVQTRTKTWDFTWSRTYNNNGTDTTRWVPASKVRQGRGGSSNYQGLLGLPSSFRTEIMNTTIEKMEIYLYHDGPYASGRIQIGTHRHTGSTPPAYSTRGGTVYNGYHSVGSWGRRSGKWVTLPTSFHSSFRSGVSRGITIGNTTTVFSLMDFISHTDSSSKRPRIRVTYTS